MKKKLKSSLMIILSLLLIAITISSSIIVTSAATSKTLSINWSNIAAVGNQPSGSDACFCYALTYSRTILDGKVYSWNDFNANAGANPYNASGAYGRANYVEAATSEISEVYRQAYNSINNGKPFIVYVCGGRSTGQHYVAIVGYTNVKSTSSLNANNFLIIDSVNGSTKSSTENLGSIGYSLKNVNGVYLYYYSSGFNGAPTVGINRTVNRQPTFQVSSEYIAPGADISYTFNAPGANSIHLYIYKGKEKYFEGEFGPTATYTRQIYETGHYSAYIVAHYNGTNVESGWIGWDVTNTPTTSIPTVSIDKGPESSYTVGGNITYTFNAPGANSIHLYIYKGKEKYFEGEFGPTATYTRQIYETGHYSAYIVAHYTGSNVESGWVGWNMTTASSVEPTPVTYSIDFDACGGTVAEKSISVLPNQKSYQLPSAERSGYLFDGWFTKKDGGNQISDNELSNINSDIILYAHWTKIISEDNGIVHFTKSKTYTQGQFTDVPVSQWYTENVANAVRYGLMKGDSTTTFNPYGEVTIAEAVTMAARIHSIYTTGTENFSSTSEPWYQAYMDYAKNNGIISDSIYHSDATKKATRAQFAEIFAKALPDKALAKINDVSDNAIPDVKTSDSYGSYVYKLYRAGILSGGDVRGTFSPYTFITRVECATIVSRMAESENRVSFSLI